MKSVVINVTVETSLNKEIVEAAKACGLKRAAWVRQLLIEEVRSHKAKVREEFRQEGDFRS